MGLTLFGVSLLVFGMVRLIPGTVVEQLLGQAAMSSPEVVGSFRRFFGLDQPLHTQYLSWLGGLLRVAATLGLSLPAFWQGAVLILLFSLYLGWMPSLQWVPFTQSPAGNLAIMALPVLTLGTATAAMITRMARSSLLDVLGREYVRTARAKGVSEPRVTFHHALRSALIPVVTVAGVQLGYIVGGIVVVEDVFTLPGVGRLLLDAIFQRDYPVVQGVILILAAVFMTLNLAVDLLYACIDPRLRRG